MPHRFHVGRLCASLCGLTALALSPAGAAAAPTVQGDAVTIALRLSPNARITAARTATHLVTYDMNHTLMSLLGSRAAPTTLIDALTTVIDVQADGVHIAADGTDSRHYGGDNPKDKTVLTRHELFTGAMRPNGVRTPAVARLGDAGDGALDQLPDAPLYVGQSWTFSRPVSIERSLGEATMTYTDTLTALGERAGHRIAMIAVSGTGPAQTASDLQAKGFHPSTFTLQGSAEFDVTDGVPGIQHYTAQVEWDAHVMFTKIGLKFADTYDAAAWTVEERHS